MAAHRHSAPLLPPGLVAARSWLLDRGVSRHTLDNWLKSGQLTTAARGVVKRPEFELTWQGVVCSLQRMGLDLSAGGLTALERQGAAHYLSLGPRRTVHLYGNSPLPGWVGGLLGDTTFLRHSPLAFGAAPEFSSVAYRTEPFSFGNERWALRMSSPELAFLEVLMQVPDSVSFEHADNLLQGLPTLSPTKLSYLLRHCQNVKVKRLFLWLAERNHEPWLKRLDLNAFSIASGVLGSGKRVIAKGGKLDRKYLITVPEEMASQPNG